MYETVSEGTPLSPPFATADELVEWLSTHKDFWDQGPRSRESAERFVKSGWAPSMVMTGSLVELEYGISPEEAPCGDASDE